MHWNDMNMKYIDILLNYIGSCFAFRMEKIEDGILVGSINGAIVGDAGLVTGKVGLALYTNGVDEYVNFGNQGDTCLGYFILCSHGWVTAFWVKLEGLPGLHAIIDTGENANKGMSIALLKGYLGVNFRSNSTYWAPGDFCSTPMQEWIHVVATWRPDYGAALYVKGELIVTDNTYAYHFPPSLMNRGLT